MYKKTMKNFLTLAVMIMSIILLGGIGTAQAFSIDVKNLYYYDPSGPREINYDFSAGTVGDGTPSTGIPVNNIGIPAGFVLQKHSADLAFMFGNVPDIGLATVTLNTTSGVSTVTTTKGGVVLQGSSPPPPPTPATSWTYRLTLKNFSGMTDATKEYWIDVGLASPSVPVPQPTIRGFWTSAGTLTLYAVIDDETTDTELWSTTGTALPVLTPASTTLDLEIVNNGTTIVFSYRLNGGSWTVLGTYTIASGLVFNSLPSRFPFLYMEEGLPESPFQVSSQHWVDINGNKYHAWMRVEDPGQALYSSVTVSSPGYLAETPMDFNSAAGYWSLSGTLFIDDFNDNAIDTAKWTTQGSSVTESGGTFNLDQAATDAGGKALSKTIVINPYAPIVVQRKAKVNYANDYFDGILGLYFGNTADFASISSLYNVMSVIVSHTNFSGFTSGFYIDRYPAHLTTPTARTDAIWGTEFVEKIVYNPVSGLAELWINGVQKASLNVGALPSTARYMKVYLDAWGWYTGHYNYSDDLTVSQPYTGGNVFLSDTTPPADPVTFNFTATKKAGGTDTVSQNITGYVTGYPTNLLPTGNVTTASPVFSWSAVAGANYYSVEVSDASGNRLWNKYDIPSTMTSYTYNGPALVNGQTYQYFISAGIETNGQSNWSFAQGSFTYTGAVSETISFIGSVKTVPNWPGTDGMVALAGTSVSAYLPGTTPALIGTVNADASTGAFTLTGIPKSTTFYLLVQPPAGYTPLLSKFMNWTADIQGLLPFALFTMGSGLQYPTGLGNTPGTGMIIGRVALENSPTTFLAGATITATQWVDGSPTATTYPVTYTSGSATQADGIYMVKDVPSGTLVQLVVTLVGHTFQFNGAIVSAQAGVVSEESFFGVAAGPVQSPFNVYSYHQDAVSGYFINMFVDDLSHAFTGVTVNGDGLSGTVSMIYNNASKRWELPVDAGGISLGTALPTGLRTYNFTAATGGTPLTGSKTVSVYVEGFAANLQPVGDVTTATPTFSWTGITGATGYALVLNDTTAGGATVWFSPSLAPQQTSLVYNGPALTAGHVYEYIVISAINTDGNGNASFARAQFTYTGGASGSTYSIFLNEATFMAATMPTKLVDFENLNTSGGKLTFTGTEYQTAAGITFSSPVAAALWVYPSSWYWNSNHLSPGEAPYEGGDNNQDSLILVFNPAVTAIGWTFVDYGGTSGESIKVYAEDNSLIYENTNLSAIGGYGAGQGNNPFWGISSPNKPIARVEIVEAANDGDDVAYDNFRFSPVGQSVGTTVISGYIKDSSATGVGIDSVAVEQFGAAPANSTTSASGGAYSLSVPSGIPFYLRFSKTGYVPTMSAQMQYADATATVGDFRLFPSGQLTTWNVSPGTGIIRTQVRTEAGNPIGGAIVSAFSRVYSTNTRYQICYDDACSPSLTATDPSTGRLIVKNVEAGDTVTVTAQASGWTFNQRVFQIAADSVHQGWLTGTTSSVTCTYNVTLPSGPYPATGVTIPYTAFVSVSAGCPWTATTADGWLHITSGAMGSGSGTVNFIVDPNSGNARSGTINIAGQSFMVNQAAGVVINNLLTNSGFYGSLNGWTINPTLGAWNPLLSDGTVNLHPDLYSFIGTIIYQNLNITGITGKTINVNMSLTKISAPDTAQNTVTAYLTYVDGSGNLVRTKVSLTPGNSGITTATPVSGSLTMPPGAQKLVKLEIAKEDYGEFHVDDIVLSGSGLTAGTLPIISGLSPTSGAYGSTLTINGTSLGTTGTLYISGKIIPTTSWSATVITANIPQGTQSGRVWIISNNVESNNDKVFQVTSPYMAVNVLNNNLTVVKGQTAEFVLNVGFFNAFSTTSGITFGVQGTGAYVNNIWSFVPGNTGLPISKPGGALLKVDTTNLAAGSYPGSITATADGQTVVAASFTLNVATIAAVNCYDAASPITAAVNVTKQGQFLQAVNCELVTTGGNKIEAPFTLESGNPAILEVYRNNYGSYDFYAVGSGSTNLTMTAPDGFQKSLDINISIPSTPQITGIGINPPTVFNTYADNIVFSATGTEAIGAGMMGLLSTSPVDSGWFDNNLSYSSTFKLNLSTEPPALGTYSFYAFTGGSSVYTSQRVTPLIIVNDDSAYGKIKGGVRPLSSNLVPQMMENYTLEFYDTTGVKQFTRTPLWTFTNQPPNFNIGGIPPGTYKVKYVPMGAPGQFWPNADDVSGAVPLTFAAGQTLDNIYFFAKTYNMEIQTAITKALTAYNNKDLTTLMSFFADNYLDDGETKAMVQANFLEEFAGTITPLPTVASNIVVTGDMATAYVAGEVGTMYLIRNDNGWQLYGNQQKYGVEAYSMYQANNGLYSVGFWVGDPTDLITSITVAGNGIVTPVALYHHAADHEWSSWDASSTDVGPQFGNTMPTGLPFTYTFTITDQTGTTTLTDQVKQFVTVTPAVTYPAANASLTGIPTFSWSPVAGDYTYGVEVNAQQAGGFHWGVYDLPSMTTSQAYIGPALTTGSYNYGISVRDMDDNFSQLMVPFTYTAAATTITVAGKVTDWNGALMPGAVNVMVVGDPTKATTTSLTDGTFSLSGIPLNTPFSLKFSYTGYTDVYSHNLGSASNITIGPYLMPLASDLAAFGLTSGKGLIAGRVYDITYRNSATVAGAVVTATGNGGKSYTVTYIDTMGNLGGSATHGNGRYYVLNVDDGNTVTVSAARNGWTFNASRQFLTHANSVSEAKIYGTPPAYDISISGIVSNSSGLPVSGARLELNGDPNKFTNSSTDGSFIVGGLPRDAVYYGKITATGYIPVFAGPFYPQGSLPGQVPTMFTAAETAGLGVASGNGLIACIVTDQILTPLSGATVSVTSKMGQIYNVVYEGGSGSTPASGKFSLLNVLPGDTVKIDVTKAGYSFTSVYMNGFGPAATETMIKGTALKGDINKSGAVDLADAILALQTAAGMNPTGVRTDYATSGVDVSGDNSPGIEEVIYILQKVAQLR